METENSGCWGGGQEWEWEGCWGREEELQMQKPRELLFLLRGRGLAWTYENIIHSKAHVGTVTGGANTKERENCHVDRKHRCVETIILEQK